MYNPSVDLSFRAMGLVRYFIGTEYVLNLIYLRKLGDNYANGEFPSKLAILGNPSGNLVNH
jgi:hypothetical protein